VLLLSQSLTMIIKCQHKAFAKQ